MIKIKVGLRVKELRLIHNLTQEKLALDIGMDRSYLAGVESGNRNISIVNLCKIWTFFNLSPQQFFDSKIFKE